MVILQVTSEQLSTLIQGAVRDALSQLQSHTTTPPDELLTVQETAEFLKLSSATIYAMVQRKELPVCKRGGRLYFSKAELIEYVKAGRKMTAADIQTQADLYLRSNKKGGYRV